MSLVNWSFFIVARLLSLVSTIQISVVLFFAPCMRMEKSVILYPGPLISHLISLVELGKLILHHHPSLSITVITFDAPFPDAATAHYIAATSAAIPSIKFHALPHIPLPPELSSDPNIPPHQLARLHNEDFRHALLKILRASQVIALVFDFFNDAALEAAGELHIPAYYFFTTSASCLTTLLYFPILHQRISYAGVADLENVVLDVTGVPPFPAKLMPPFQSPQNSLLYTGYLGTANQMRKAAGIIVNTFESLEERAVEALNNGNCVPDNRSPQIYCIGPLINSNASRDEHKHECLSWLSSQRSRSVVFLSFGSMGLFSKKQLWEIAEGLESSGHGFLWVVRNPPEDPSAKQSVTAANAEPNLEELLPEGFVERTRGKGLVVKSWAPQVAVLSHDSVGGFVSHCGWNSVLEAVSAGVPILAWPLYAEQAMSAVFLVEETKVALPLAEEVDGIVTAEEVARGVRELMGTESGRKRRDRVMDLRDRAAAAMKDGGSSIVALTKLIQNSGTERHTVTDGPLAT